MGCKACKTDTKNYNGTITQIIKCIQTANLSSLDFFIKSYVKSTKESKEFVLNSRCLNVNEFQLNFLAYTIAIGSHKGFKYFYDHCGCSFQLMHQNFNDYGMDPLNIICEKNYFELLKHFLPIYLSYIKVNDQRIETTLDFDSNLELNEPTNTYTAIQTACMNGLISIVDYLYQFNIDYPDPRIDITLNNEITGESCALLSVKSGNLAMVKLLFENYKLDFHCKNKSGENALLICAINCTKYDGPSYTEVFMFLVDFIGINVVENHEEILLILENPDLIEYYETLLSQKGIKTRKIDLEKIYQVKDYKIEVINDESLHIKDMITASSEISSINIESVETVFRADSLFE
jgi:hypothetical protein